MRAMDHGELSTWLLRGNVALASVVVLLGLVGFARHRCPVGLANCTGLFGLWEMVQITGFTLVGVIAPIAAVLRVALQQWKTGRIVAFLTHARQPLPPHLVALAQRLGLTGRIVLSAAPLPRAFTVGFWHPTVVLTRAAVDLLSVDELEAVLRHEREHVWRRDPLRFALADSLWRVLLPFPLLRDAARAFMACAEMAADEAALTGMGSPVSLASAMVKLLRYGAGTPSAAAGAAGVGDVRLKHLLGQKTDVMGLLSWKSWLISAGSLGVLGGLALLCT